MLEQVLRSAEERMEKAVQTLKRELASVRAGRASPALLEKVTVEYYGTPMPVTQVATVTTPEPRMIVISPWEKSMLGEIERAIQKSDLGLTPNNDGSVIRLILPPLTEERRQELVRLVRKMSEEARVAVRNVRRDANDELKKLGKSGDVSADEVRRDLEKVQQLTDRYVGEIDRLCEAKEQELLEV